MKRKVLKDVKLELIDKRATAKRANVKKCWKKPDGIHLIQTELQFQIIKWRSQMISYLSLFICN